MTDILIDSKAELSRPASWLALDRSLADLLRFRQSQSGERARAAGGDLAVIPNCASNSLARSASVTSSTALSRPPQGQTMTSKSYVRAYYDSLTIPFVSCSNICT